MSKLLTLMGYSFSPADIPGLALWLDAADAGSVTRDGGNAVSAWADKSGKGNHATQGTAANKPAYQAAGLNGRPALYCANDFLTVADHASLDHTGLTLFAVTAAAVDNNGVHYIVWKWQDSTQREFILMHDFANNDTRVNASSNGSSVNGVITGGALSLGTAQILELYNDNGGATGIDLLINGASAGADASPGTIFNGGDSLKIGHSGTGGENTISEALYYTGALSSAQRVQIRRYLAAKWGIAL